MENVKKYNNNKIKYLEGAPIVWHLDDLYMEYYKFKDFDKCVDKKTIINKGNLLFYKLGVIFIIFLYATRK